MKSTQSPELVALFEKYTAHAQSIGAHLTRAVSASRRSDPLIVATGTDVALFPGDHAAPSVESFRVGTRGFKELAAISHLGPALASLVNLRKADPDGPWRADAVSLLEQTERAREANSPALWAETIAVEAYCGREQAISDMVDYACSATSAYLRRCLVDSDYLAPEPLRRDFLEGGRVPFNHVMVATFFLTALDIGFRILRWFGAAQIDWDRAMVLVTGKQGRATSGVTWNTSTIATIILGASGGRLGLDRLYVAPHAPSLSLAEARDVEAVRALEQPLRDLWCNVRATIELAPVMFDGYPRFSFRPSTAPELTYGQVAEVSEMPAVRSPEDMLSLVTRLRLVLEDPRQLLSGCVMDYAIRELVASGNSPADVTVPGLTGVRYAAS